MSVYNYRCDTCLHCKVSSHYCKAHQVSLFLIEADNCIRYKPKPSEVFKP